MLVMTCINFPITVRLLQNNERGFPLIFTITLVEYEICTAVAHCFPNILDAIVLENINLSEDKIERPTTVI
jgi:hypothetical protein